MSLVAVVSADVCDTRANPRNPIMQTANYTQDSNSLSSYTYAQYGIQYAIGDAARHEEELRALGGRVRHAHRYGARAPHAALSGRHGGGAGDLHRSADGAEVSYAQTHIFTHNTCPQSP